MAEASASGTDPRRRIEAALTAVRREGWKAALTVAVVDAAVAFLAGNLALAALSSGWLPDGAALPAAVTEPLADAVGLGTPVGVPGSAAVAAGLAGVVFAVDVWLRVRRPLVEQFEAANPEVAEALRTARDAVDADADSEMAARLYEDVVDRLGETSGVALLDGRRLVATAVVVVLLSLATLQVAAADLALFDGPEVPEEGESGLPDEYTGLRDGEEVLGDSESVDSGDQEIEAGVESTGGGRDVDESERFPAGGAAGGSDGTGVDTRQAGFAAPDRVEDAELVREYNRRIREESDD